MREATNLALARQRVVSSRLAFSKILLESSEPMNVEHASSFSCGACQKQGDASAVKLCSVCGTARYCSVDCQKDDWAKHKTACTTAAAKAMFAAIARSDAETVRRLAKTKRVLNARVDHAKDPDDRGRALTLKKWTPLHECVIRQNADMMAILLEQEECNVHITDGDGETPLFVASSGDHLPVVRLLLHSGAIVHDEAEDGWNCLMMAARAGSYDVSKELLDNGADPHTGGGMFGQSPLFMVQQIMHGQGIRIREGESFEQAKARYARVYQLLQLYE
jgi:Ankyrin repeats (3 copies)/MYND finger